MRISLALQWIGLHTSTEEDTGSVPSQELRSHKPHSVAQKEKKKKVQNNQMGYV